MNAHRIDERASPRPAAIATASCAFMPRGASRASDSCIATHRLESHRPTGTSIADQPHIGSFSRTHQERSRARGRTHPSLRATPSGHSGARRRLRTRRPSDHPAIEHSFAAHILLSHPNRPCVASRTHQERTRGHGRTRQSLRHTSCPLRCALPALRENIHSHLRDPGPAGRRD